jgi:hypothetical protein
MMFPKIKRKRRTSGSKKKRKKRKAKIHLSTGITSRICQKVSFIPPLARGKENIVWHT